MAPIICLKKNGGEMIAAVRNLQAAQLLPPAARATLAIATRRTFG